VRPQSYRIGGGDRRWYRGLVVDGDEPVFHHNSVAFSTQYYGVKKKRV
jgi:hypothetical protein